MLKRRILAIILVSMVFMGVVSASSINGDYKGNPIVKVMSNGKQLQSDEVPAMIYDGHTVVPISLLRQIGASVNWNADNYSVDVTLPQNSPTVAPSNSLRDAVKNAGNNIEFYYIGDKFYVNSYLQIKSLNDDWNNVVKVIDKLTAQDADFYSVTCTLNGANVGSIILDHQSVVDFASGKIDSKELDKRWVKNGFQNSSTSSNSTPTTQPVTVQPTAQPTTSPQQTQPQNNNAQIIAQYNLLSDFYFTLQRSVLVISGFVVTSDQYYDKWDKGSIDKLSDAQFGQEYKKALGQASEVYNTAVMLDPKIPNMDYNKRNDLIKELYSLSNGIISAHDAIFSWKVAKFDAKTDDYNVNIKIANGYLSDYTNYSKDLFNRAMQLNEKIKNEINNARGIVYTLQ